MQLKVNELQAIDRALNLIETERLSEEAMEIVLAAKTAVLNCYNRRDTVNKRTWDYIKARRKTDPNYCR